METVTIHRAKTELSRLIARVEAGEEIVVARGNTPVVRMVPFELVQPNPAARRLGWLAHTLPPGFEWDEDAVMAPCYTDAELDEMERVKDARWANPSS